MNERELSRFQDPSILHAKLSPESLEIPNKIFFSGPELMYQKLREGWVASLFARGFSNLIKPCEVRMCYGENFPDFEIRADSSVLPFECTEVLELERRRGDEYKSDTVPHEFLLRFADPDEAARRISACVGSKANRHYAPKPHLLVYVNFWVANRIDLNRVRESCDGHRPSFKSLWLLWAFSIAQVFSNEDLGDVCRTWNEIPGYREECEQKMGWPSSGGSAPSVQR